MLTADQIETFKRDGVLALRGFFSPEEVCGWREEILAYFSGPATGEDWRLALRTHKADAFRLDPDPTPASHPKLSSLYRALHAQADWHGENELVMRPGDEEAPWLGARAPHLDFPIAAPVRTLANNVIYLSDVEDHGGAFMFWPGSHHIAWRYFSREPNDYLSQGARSQDQTFAILTRLMIVEPVQMVGRAGDLFIWHSLLLHSASVNKRPDTRFALIGRWGVPLTSEPFYDFDAEMWSYWRFRGEDARAAEAHHG